MTPADTLAAQVADRARDPNFQGTSQANTILLASYAQQMVNGMLHDVVVSAPLTLTPRLNYYQLSTLFPSLVKLLAVRDASGRDLVPMYGGAEELSWADMRWPSSTTDAPRSFAVVGRDQLIIYPGVKTAQTVTLFYSQLTPVLVAGASTVVPNEDDDAVYDLTEALLLIKNRDLFGASAAMDRFKERIAMLRGERR